MIEKEQYQKEVAAMDPRLTGRVDATPIAIQLTLRLAPAILEAAAAESRRQGCGLEEVVTGLLVERFAERAS